MAVHLSHKIRWDFLADYHTPFLHKGITLPVGDCGLIHAAKKKHQIQVQMRKYISEDMICKDRDCKITGDREFRKSNAKGAPFTGTGDEKKLHMFVESFYSAVHEFATTELESKHAQHESVEVDTDINSLTFCTQCNEFIHNLEFGDKHKLFEYSDSELDNIFSCQHGGQAVGNNIKFLLFHILKFYCYSNIIVYLDLRKEDQWPAFMKPSSYFRMSLTCPCDGQTFLPHSRHLLAKAMIDVDETRTLSKRLFRFIYFYVMMRMKRDSSYQLKDDLDSWYF